MMKTTVLLAIGSFMVWGCNNHADHHKHAPETTQEEHRHDGASVAIELNNGAKWTVNEEMKAPIASGEELVNTYINTNQTNYKELAQQLKAQNDMLIKSCTMQGKSHDELHKWLHPHLELVKELENASAENTAQETVLKLQSSYTMYHEYFE